MTSVDLNYNQKNRVIRISNTKWNIYFTFEISASLITDNKTEQKIPAKEK